ncbi:MAG: indole-3-glycerol-phosphate synthase [Candidatus Hydrogenedentota bacterium]|nr:MAG: indole-3-glycerol-phosphate synthase [Candidatus Hydrogenedentota bacterium]
MISVETILEAKQAEVERLRKERPWEKRSRRRGRYSFRKALARDGLSIIAEIKRSSPSTGSFEVEPRPVLEAYEAAGVDALSILSDRHFGMSPEEFEDLAAKTSLPVLRKDFLLAPEQIRESVVLGADAVLVIVAFLEDAVLEALLDEARDAQLDVLVEIHSAEDLKRLPRNTEIVGINNRDLSSPSYETDANRARELARDVPAGYLLVAESGYESPEDLPQRADAVLIGGAFLRHVRRFGEVKSLVEKFRTSRAGDPR